MKSKSKPKSKQADVGSKVQWNWMGHKVQGTIQKIYLKPVTKIYRGTTFKRNGSEENPSYVIISKAGNHVLKSHAELTFL